MPLQIIANQDSSFTVLDNNGNFFAKTYSSTDALLIASSKELLDALRDLHDLQNGPPLIRHEAEWTKAMTGIAELLNRLNG